MVIFVDLLQTTNEFSVLSELKFCRLKWRLMLACCMIAPPPLNTDVTTISNQFARVLATFKLHLIIPSNRLKTLLLTNDACHFNTVVSLERAPQPIY